ncbi:glycoside hydrolase 43 family protein [Bacteroides sp. BFG-257]|uniref:glycoside hydrolase family 43 protein n=1 Tax=Bacteroides TaxID=816 RepID=UPI001CCDE14D|nr:MULTISPECIES: glycoside hydrolase 43 family protein [Bacteroides]UBD71924.1 glycoside hydrolase 43 family protein [Bacteroides cellulosilyticus]UVP00530.1 glycoside hydrolase 43 family protein [Bacteroides sp. BFG-257]
MKARKTLMSLCLLLALPLAAQQKNYVSEVWVADQGNGKYKNPVLYADYSDPDACRVGDDYYMTSSSFNCLPGLQILHSKDLVNWTIIGAAVPYALPPIETPERPEHGNRVWAPAIRHHNGEFYIFWGDPDQGAFMVKAKDPKGPWTEPVLVKPGKGIIDTCPLWDEDGKVYMVHAYAGSRAELKSVITICELNAEATKAITPSRIVFDGHEVHQTCEGPKFYKRNGYYYIFHPAGGVPTGWQVVLRSKNVYGPYEWKTVLAQGNSPVNGPHQGAWVDTPTGEDWFFHFQDVGAYGRLVHLQPMKWVNDWPVIGIDKDGDGCGEPVMTYKKPNVGKTYPICTPQESDEFDGYTLSPQWQWHANINEKWAYYAGDQSIVRLYSYPVVKEYKNLFDVANLLLQKAPAPNFTATMKLTFKPVDKYKGERTGLVVMGMDYAGLILENTDKGLVLSQVSCLKADKGTPEQVNGTVDLTDNTIYLKVKFSSDANKKISKSEGGHDLLVMCDFSYSLDGKKYQPLGKSFQAKEGKWIGVKVGTFCTRPAITTNDGGWADVDWFRITKK